MRKHLATMPGRVEFVFIPGHIYLYFDEINAEPVVFHWKYNFDDINVSEKTLVDTLPIKKSS